MPGPYEVLNNFNVNNYGISLPAGGIGTQGRGNPIKVSTTPTLSTPVVAEIPLITPSQDFIAFNNGYQLQVPAGGITGNFKGKNPILLSFRPLDFLKTPVIPSIGSYKPSSVGILKSTETQEPVVTKEESLPTELSGIDLRGEQGASSQEWEEEPATKTVVSEEISDNGGGNDKDSKASRFSVNPQSLMEIAKYLKTKRENEKMVERLKGLKVPTTTPTTLPTFIAGDYQTKLGYDRAAAALNTQLNNFANNSTDLAQSNAMLVNGLSKSAALQAEGDAAYAKSVLENERQNQAILAQNIQNRTEALNANERALAGKKNMLIEAQNQLGNKNANQFNAFVSTIQNGLAQSNEAAYKAEVAKAVNEDENVLLFKQRLEDALAKLLSLSNKPDSAEYKAAELEVTNATRAYNMAQNIASNTYLSRNPYLLSVPFARRIPGITRPKEDTDFFATIKKEGGKMEAAEKEKSKRADKKLFQDAIDKHYKRGLDSLRLSAGAYSQFLKIMMGIK